MKNSSFFFFILLFEIKKKYSNVVKFRLRNTIANLESRLQEAKDDSCCVALNRLREKLREMMRDGKMGDQQMSFAVDKSIGALVELSKDCDDLREENRRLLAEVETLK